MKMKKNKILGLILALIMFFTNLPFGMGVVHAETDIKIDNTNFPDQLFKEYVEKEFDTNIDGTLSKEECDAVKKIDVSFEKHGYNDNPIKSLVGIEHFQNLESLNFCNQGVRKIDLSKNLKLKTLDCTFNSLNNLDVSYNTELTELICERIGLYNLFLDRNEKLVKLDCTNNKLSKLNLNKNTELIDLTCTSNYIESLNLGNNTKLTSIDCKQNAIKDLDLSKNKELTYLNCSQNKLSNLNLENNPLITKLSISRNDGFKELKLAKDNKLDTLYCTYMGLEKLDLSNCNNLKELNCESNNLKELDLSNCLEITDVNCSYNSLTSLDLSKNAKLNSFKGYLQNYTMTLIPGTKLVNPDILPGKFDISNVSNLQNADIDQGKLSLHDNIDSIEYVYEVRDGRNMGCKININYYTDLTINTPPSNVEYTEGDKLDLSGLVVTLTDKQNNSINVDFKDFGKYNIKSNPENGKELTTSHTYNGIIISAGTLKAKVNVTVNEKPFDIEKVESIEVINQPTNLIYTEGDKLDLSGLEIKLTDSNKKTKNIEFSKFKENGIATEPANGTELKLEQNGKTVKITKGKGSAYTDPLTVNKIPFDIEKVESIEVINQPTNIIYTEGNKLDLSGLEIKLTDSNKKTKNIEFSKFKENGIATEPANGTELKLEQNRKTVKITKGKGNAETDPLTVKAKVFDPDHVKSIEVTEQPKKLTYTEEEPLELDGLVVTLTDNKGTTKEVAFADFETNGLVATPANGTKLTVADHNRKTVKITKDNLTPAETYALTVNSKNFDLDNVVTIEILNQPSKISYTEGEKLNLAGLRVKLTDNKGNVKEVSFEKFDENGITTEPTNAKELTLSENGKKVTITKGNGSEETDALTVNPKVFDSQNITKIEVKAQPKLDYTEDDNLNLSELEVTLTDNQGLTEDVAFEKFVDYGLTATPANETKLTVADHDGKTIIIEKGNVSGKTNALTVKAKANPPEPTDPKIIGPVDSSQAPADIENYFVIKFESSNEEQGTVAVENLVYVPKTLSSKTLADIKAPEVTAKPGYEFEKWSLPINTAIDKNLTVKAIFKAQGTVNPPVEPSIPSDNIIGPVDSESNLYKELDKHKDEYYKLIFDDNDYTRIYVLFVKKGQGIRLTDIAAYAPNVVADEGYVFTGWSPMLYGNTELIENDRYIVAEFEEIGRPYRPYWPDYREERPYRPYRPYRHYEDDRDTEPVVEEKPVEVNEYDKLEAILFINDSIMQKSVNGVVSQVRMDIAPFIYQARTMLPIRYVAESLGFMVTWDANTRTVYLVDKENIVQIPVDTNNIIVNGKAFVSDVKPMIKNNRTMLPVANVARALGLQDGKDILWDAAMKFVTLRRNVLK